MADLQQIRVKIGNFIVPINPKSIAVKLGKKTIRHEVPGRDGDIIQVLGLSSKEITFSGQFVTESDKKSIELLREYEKKEVLELIVPIRLSSMSNSTLIILDKVNITDSEGRYDWKDYDITCIEWRAPEVKMNQVILLNEEDRNAIVEILRVKKQL